MTAPQLSRQLKIGLALAAVVTIADQLTKWWIVHHVMDPPRSIEVLPFFNLVMTWNRGVSFGLLSSDAPWHSWLLIAVAAVIVAVLVAWLHRAERWIVAIGIGLVVGGAIGNVIDRVRWGAVADFLDFHVAGYHWPAFNVADSGITVGAVLLVLDSLMPSRDLQDPGDGQKKERVDL